MSHPSHATAADTGRPALLSFLPVLLALPVLMAGRPNDPVFRAIECAQVARDEFADALAALAAAERDKARLRAADEAAERDTVARDALAMARPQTREGLHALIRHYADDVSILEPNTSGAKALRDLVEALPPPAAASEPGRSLPRRISLIAVEAVALMVMCGGGAAVAQLGRLF